MKEKDIHNLIEQQEPEKKQAAFKRIQERLNIAEVPAVQTAKPKKSVKKRAFAWSAVMAVALCLAIVLPITLTGTPDVKDRYCVAGDYETYPTEFNIEQYASNINQKILFVDWYDIAEECLTDLYVNVNDRNDMIYLQELLVNGETGEIVDLYITDKRTKVDILSRWDSCTTVKQLEDTEVLLDVTFQSLFATFKYGYFVYYLEITNVDSESRALEIIASMLPAK